MTATEELRRLLDERGVEWYELVGHPMVVGTAWNDRDGCPCTALEYADDVPDGMLNVQENLTPEQAIAATLGAVDVGALQAKVKAQSNHINKLRGEYKALDEQMERRCAEYRATIRNLKAELDAATLGGGKLTAEQVRETIERHFGRVAVLDDGKPVEWRDDWVCKVAIDYRAIADELNTRAERTCYNMSHRVDESRFHCSECEFGCWVKDVADGRDKLPRYCPNCGARRVDE